MTKKTLKVNNKALKKRLRKVRSLKDIELEKHRIKYDMLRSGQASLESVEDVRSEFASGRAFSFFFSFLMRQVFGSKHQFFRSFLHGFRFFAGRRSKRKKNNNLKT